MLINLFWTEAWAVPERRYLKKDSTEARRAIIFEVSRPEKRSSKIILFETSKLITPRIEPIPEGGIPMRE